MKLKVPARTNTVPLSTTNEPFLVSQRPVPCGKSALYYLLNVLAETLDAASTGENAWITLGKSLDGTTFLLTLHAGAQKAYAAGNSLEELAVNCQNLLEGA